LATLWKPTIKISRVVKNLWKFGEFGPNFFHDEYFVEVKVIFSKAKKWQKFAMKQNLQQFLNPFND